MAKIRKTEGTSHVNDKDACKDGEGQRWRGAARDNDGEGRRGTTMARGEDVGKGKMKGEVPIMTPLPYSSRGRFSEVAHNFGL